MAEANENWRTRLDRIERTMDIVAQEMTDAQRRAEERMQLSEERMDRIDKRLDHITEIMTLLAQDHITFRDEHKRLLVAQVVLDDRMKNVAKTLEELSDSHKETRAALNDLIKIVDGIIRARPPQ